MSIPWQPKTPPKPLIPALPQVLALPANAPTRAIQMLTVDPYYPRDHALRMQGMAAAIASQAGVRLSFPQIADFLMPAWINFTEDMLPSVRNYAKQHTNHVVLLVKTIFISRPTDTRFVGGLGGSRFSIIAAVSCDTVLAHELGHAAGLPHLDIDGNFMHGRSCGGAEMGVNQAAALRAWAGKSAGARVVDDEKVWVC